MAGYSVSYTVVDEATAKIDAINRRVRQMREPMERQARAMSKFMDVAGINKVAEGFKSIASTAGSAFGALGRLVPAFGALFGATTIAGAVKLTDSFTKLGNQLKTTADRIGIAPQTLQVLQDATEKAGGNVDDMTASLTGLADISAAAFTGRDPEAAQWFRAVGISLTDANGHLKTADQLLPEVNAKLDAIKNPADRMQAAIHLGGESLFKLNEEFRKSGKPINDWIEDAKKLTPLSNEQLSIFQKYSEAQGNIRTAITHLGEQISAMLANNFTPLLNHLAEFVNKHQKDIVAAIDTMSQKFAAWLSGIKWSDVEAGLTKVGDAFKFVIDHLDQIKLAAEIFFGLWVAAKFAGVLKGFGDLVGAITSVHDALKKTPDVAKGAEKGLGDLGTIGGGKADSGGTGLLGKLASMVNVVTLAKLGLEEYQKQVGKPLEWQNVPENSPLRQHLSEAGKAAAGAAPAQEESNWWTRTRGAVRGALGLGGKELPQENKERGASIRDKLSADLGLTKEQASGIVGNLQAESGLKAVQEKSPIAGRGGYGWAQWTGPRRTAFEQHAASQGLDVKSDEANYSYLLKELQSKEYAGVMSGVRGSKSAAESAAVFEAGFERPAVSNAATRGRYAEQIAGYGAPKEVTGGAPVNGAVDITVKHVNPPPGATVTATGTGDGVNVGQPRTERQQFAWT